MISWFSNEDGFFLQILIPSYLNHIFSFCAALCGNVFSAHRDTFHIEHGSYLFLLVSRSLHSSSEYKSGCKVSVER